MKNLVLLILSLISSALNGQIQNLNVLIYSTYDTNRKEWRGRGKNVSQINFYPFGFDTFLRKSEYFKIKTVSVPIDKCIDIPDGLPMEAFKNHAYNHRPSFYFLRDTLIVSIVGCYRNNSNRYVSSDGYPYQCFKYNSILSKWIPIHRKKIEKRLYYLKWYGGPSLYTFPFRDGLDKGFYQAVNLIVNKFHSKEDKIYIVSDYLPYVYFYKYVGPKLPVIKFGQSPRKYKRRADWFIGYPSYEFHHDTLVISTSYFRSKDYSKRKLPQLLKQKVSVRLAFNRDSLKWKEVVE